MHTIHARLNHPDAAPGYKDLYCFTDPEKDLLGEPLMEEATGVIRSMFIFSKQEPAPVVIRFTDSEDEAADTDTSVGYLCILSDPQPERDGTSYALVVTHPKDLADTFNTGQAFLGAFLKVWLCPALLKYFDTVPTQIFIQILEENDEATLPQ